MTDHPITPPQLKVYRWWEEACKRPPSSFYEKLDYVVTQAAEWGADQELKACCELLDINGCPGKWIDMLRAARRPVPPNLAEAALDAQSRMWAGTSTHDDWELVRRALERLQELEDG